MATAPAKLLWPLILSLLMFGACAVPPDNAYVAGRAARKSCARKLACKNAVLGVLAHV